MVRRLFLTLIAVYLAAPLVVVCGVSFNREARMTFPPRNPNWHWYGVFFADGGWISALAHSLEIATLAALVSMSIALPIAYVRWRDRSPVAGWLEAIARLPFLVPLIVLGILFLAFWSWLGHVGRIENTILSHAVVFAGVPLATLAIGFRSIDPAYVEAARTMGARAADVFRTILVPLLFPYVACGITFVFILSLNEYIIAYLVAGYEVETLPIKVFNSLRMGFQPTMCVGAMLFVAVGVLGFSAIAVIGDLPKLLGGRSR